MSSPEEEFLFARMASNAGKLTQLRKLAESRQETYADGKDADLARLDIAPIWASEILSILEAEDEGSTMSDLDAVAVEPRAHLARILDAHARWVSSVPLECVDAWDALEAAITAAREWVGTEVTP